MWAVCHFYSRASARRDAGYKLDGRGNRISTHAPLRGATKVAESNIRLTVISTHAPLRGATPPRFLSSVTGTNFYSRASARRDSCPRMYRPRTHRFLLTRLCEARPTRGFILSCSCNFYSRASARRDANRGFKVCDLATISTHAPLRGATWSFRGLLLVTDDFYSRASARRDSCLRQLRARKSVFLLTRLCEARPRSTVQYRRTSISTHAPLRGATATFST